jgi:hypothetical protein
VTVAISAENNCAVVEIPDADGEVFAYECRAVGLVGGWRSWSVVRRGDEGEHSHTVGTHGGRFRCSCKSFQFNPARWVAGCKHTASVREVLDFYKKLTGVES